MNERFNRPSTRPAKAMEGQIHRTRSKAEIEVVLHQGGGATMASGTDSQDGPRLMVDPSAGQAAFRDHAETWLKGLVGIKPKTRAGYESLLRSRILPALGDHQLRRIDPASVRQWIAAMDDEGLSPSRIRQAHQVLRASLDQAVEDGLIGRNPATGVSVPTDPHREMKFLDARQIERLSTTADNYMPSAGVVVRLLAWTGIR